MLPTFKDWLNRASRIGLKKRKRVRKVSPKREAAMKEYLRLRAIFLSAHFKCQVNWKGCTGKATEIHHSKGRGKNLNDVASFVATCRPCHTAIHSNPSLARHCGLLK